MPGPAYLDAPLGAAAESWFCPMGMTLRLVTDSPEIRAAAEDAFGAFGHVPPAQAPDFTLRLFAHEVDDTIPLRTALRADGPLVYQTAGRGSTLVLDRERGLGFGYFSPAVLADRVFFRWHFLDLALFFFLEGRGFLGVHGAALAHGGRALLLRAPSGAGKSTLTYAASRRRFQALAEDLAWIAPGGIAVWGMPWTFHLLPDAATLFPELSAGTPGVREHVQHNGEDKLAVDLERMRPGSTTPSAAPAGVVFLRRAPGGRSRLETVDSTAAWTDWLAGAASRERSAPEYDRRAGELLRAVPAYRLTLGDDLEAALDLIEPLVDPHPPTPSPTHPPDHPGEGAPPPASSERCFSSPSPGGMGGCVGEGDRGGEGPGGARS
jgi:hypothetical protein